jgi:DNA-binding transcriptional ArsR family regulator
MPDDPELRRLLWFLLGGSRGGESRARIINELRARPSNLNQLSKQLDLDYRSIQHHIQILHKNQMIVSSGEKYGMTYSVHPWLEAHYTIFEEICGKLNFTFVVAGGEQRNQAEGRAGKT